MTNNNYNQRTPWRFTGFLCGLIVFLGLLATNVNAQTPYIVTPTGGTAGNTDGTGADPVCRYFNSIRYQVVYTVAELSAAGIPSGGVISKLAWNVTTSSVSLANYTIKMGHTAATNSASHNVDATTTVKNAFTYAVATGYNDITFDANFTWNGTSNIVIEICTGTTNPFTSPYGGVQAKTGVTAGSRSYRVDAASACGTNTSSTLTTKPYVRLTVAAGGACAGTPTPGNTTSSANPVCSGVAFTLGLQNSTSGSGVTYQWFNSANNVSFSPITGATSSTYSATQSVATYYRCEVTCATGPSTGTSTSVYVTMNPFTSCYCASAFTSVSFEFITNVNFAGINNTSAGTIGGPVNYTGQTATVTQGSTSTLSVTIDPDASDYVYAWIDWNQNGSFADVGETYTVATNTSSAGPHSLSISIPITATLGTTRMRVMVDYNNAIPNPCRSATYGEAEQYSVLVNAPAPCTNPPTPGTAVATPSSGCAPLSFGATLSGHTFGVGQTYQWQDSPDGVTYTNISGATNDNYSGSASADKYLKCVLTCGVSATSAPAFVDVSLVGTGNVYADPIYVSSNSSTSGNNNSANCWTNAYTTVSTPGSANAQGSRDVFYTFTTGPCADSIVVETVTPGTLTDTYIHLLDNAGVLIESDDDDGAGNLSYIKRAVAPNTQYYVVVEGFNLGEGTWTLNINEIAPNDNDISGAELTTDDDDNEICGAATSINLSIANGVLGVGADYKWYTGSCGGTLVGSGASVSVVPGFSRTYYVRIEGTCGMTTCLTVSVVVKTSGPGGTVQNVVVPSSGCNGDNISGSVPVISNATYYNWSGPSGTTFDGYPSPAHITNNNPAIVLGAPLSSGWSICVQGENACGVTSNTKCTFIRGTVSQPSAISGASIGCANTSGSYSISAVAGADLYEWTMTGDATVSGSGTSATVTFGPAYTSGTLCVRAKLNCGTASAYRCMTISNTTALPGVITGASVACPSSSGSYSIAPVAGAVSYNWSVSCVGGSASGTGTTATISFPASFSSCVVTVTANSACGAASAPRSKTVANGKPGTPSSITGNLNGVCGSQQNYSCPSVAGATSYNWTIGSGIGSVSNGQGTTGITVDWNATGTVGTLSVVAINGCGNSGARTVNIRLVPGVNTGITGDASVTCNNVGNYAVGQAAGATNYNWSVLPAGPAIIPTGNTAIVDFDGQLSGNYTVYATSVNACGNGNTHTFAVNHASCARVTQDLATGAKLEVNAYPNPAHQLVTINFNSSVDNNFTLKLVDLSGRAVFNGTGKSLKGNNVIDIDLSSVSKGVYMLQLNNGSEQSMIRLIVE